MSSQVSILQLNVIMYYIMMLMKFADFSQWMLKLGYVTVQGSCQSPRWDKGLSWDKVAFIKCVRMWYYWIFITLHQSGNDNWNIKIRGCDNHFNLYCRRKLRQNWCSHMYDFIWQVKLLSLKSIQNVIKIKREWIKWWQISSITLVCLQLSTLTLVNNLYFWTISFQNISIDLYMFPKNNNG